MKKLLGYRVYRELTYAGEVIHKTPAGWTGNKKVAFVLARANTNGAVYAVYYDGTEKRIC